MWNIKNKCVTETEVADVIRFHVHVITDNDLGTAIEYKFANVSWKEVPITHYDCNSAAAPALCEIKDGRYHYLYIAPPDLHPYHSYEIHNSKYEINGEWRYIPPGKPEQIVPAQPTWVIFNNLLVLPTPIKTTKGDEVMLWDPDNPDNPGQDARTITGQLAHAKPPITADVTIYVISTETGAIVRTKKLLSRFAPGGFTWTWDGKTGGYNPDGSEWIGELAAKGIYAINVCAEHKACFAPEHGADDPIAYNNKILIVMAKLIRYALLKFRGHS